MSQLLRGKCNLESSLHHPPTNLHTTGRLEELYLRNVSELSSKLESILASRVDLNYKSCCLDQCFQTSLPTEPQLYFCLCHFKKVTEKATSQLSCFAAEITEIGHRVIYLTALFMATCLYIFKSQLQWAIVHLYTVETYMLQTTPKESLWYKDFFSFI